MSLKDPVIRVVVWIVAIAFAIRLVFELVWPVVPYLAALIAVVAIWRLWRSYRDRW